MFPIRKLPLSKDTIQCKAKYIEGVVILSMDMFIEKASFEIIDKTYISQILFLFIVCLQDEFQRAFVYKQAVTIHFLRFKWAV